MYETPANISAMTALGLTAQILDISYRNLEINTRTLHINEDLLKEKNSTNMLLEQILVELKDINSKLK